jgi:hypothetical protein
MDQERQRQAGTAPGRCGVDSGGDAAQAAAAAAQAICRTLHGGLLDAAVLAAMPAWLLV